MIAALRDAGGLATIHPAAIAARLCPTGDDIASQLIEEGRVRWVLPCHRHIAESSIDAAVQYANTATPEIEAKVDRRRKLLEYLRIS
jgi:hypothetical protein